MKRFDTKKIVGLSIFTAIVVVLQLMGSFIHFGMFSISLVLVPIVVGAALYGAVSGAWLGFVFAVVVLISGDAAAFLVVNPLGTILTVVSKGVLCGLVAGLVYNTLKEKKDSAAVMASAIACPVINTGVFLIGCVLFFMKEPLTGWAQALGFGDDVVKYMFFGLAGGNFVFELIFNVALSPVIVRLIKLGKTRIR